MRLLSSLLNDWPMEESWLWLMLSRISQVSIVLLILGIIFFVGFIVGRASVKIQLQSDESKVDTLRTKLFETLGHTIRMRILQCLGEDQLYFSELKRRVGIESSGHIQFHLEKLDGLIKVTPEGKYALTDEGKEALRLVGQT